MGLPYFTYEQPQKVVEAINASQRLEVDSVEARYDADQDAFSFFFESSGESDDFSSVEIKGQKFCPIGSFCWIWEQVSKELPT